VGAMAHPPGDEADQHWSRVLLDALEEGFTLQGRHGEILATNPAAGQILGLSTDQLWGRSSLDPRWHAVHDDGSDFPGAEHPAMVTLATGRPVSGQVMGVYRPDGSLVWIKISSRPLSTGPGGLPTGVITSFTDITAERASEAAMTLHRQRLEAVVASLPVGVMVVTASEHVSVVNVEFCRMFGLSQHPQSLRGAPVSTVLWSLAPLLGDVDAILDRIQARATEQLPVHANEVVLTDGRVVEVDLHTMSVGPPAEGVGGAGGGVPAVAGKELVIVCHDITARIETSRALAAARDAAEAASRLKSDFLATLSHEVRTPISGIVGMVELLLRLPLDEDVLEVVEGVRNSAEALAVQLEDLLDLARIEAGRLELRPAPFDLRDLSERSVQVFGQQARDKHIVLVSGVAGDVPDLVVGDLNRVRQVLLNLVGNAVKFTPAGQVVVDVTASGPDEVTLTVSDTGPGLPEDAREQLFAPFVQVDPSTDRRHGGFGLGLAICSRLVALMGGRIEVESRHGKGARFVVVLPMPSAPGGPGSRASLQGHRVRLEASPSGAVDVLRRSLVDSGAVLVGTGHDAQTVLVVDDTAGGIPGRLRTHPTVAARERLVVLSSTNEPVAASAGGPVVLALPVTMARLSRAVLGETASGPLPVEVFPGGRVLLAEDNEVNVLLLARMVGLLGLTCDTVTDGTEALGLLRRNTYDVVLMDVHMPRVDGVAATRILRAMEGPAHTPVLALTASAAAEEERRCREAGMDGFVTKPVGIAELRAALAPYVGRPAPAPPSAAGAPGPPRLDPGRLNDLVEQLGDVELVRETVTAYLEELGPRTAAIDDAVMAGDRDALRLLTHSLKSSSAMLGAVAMSEQCAAAERVALTATAEELATLREAVAGLSAPTAQALRDWAAGS